MRGERRVRRKSPAATGNDRLRAPQGQLVSYEGAPAVLMSGSGSTTFALVRGREAAEALQEQVQARFGPVWAAVAAI